MFGAVAMAFFAACIVGIFFPSSAAIVTAFLVAMVGIGVFALLNPKWFS